MVSEIFWLMRAVRLAAGPLLTLATKCLLATSLTGNHDPTPDHVLFIPLRRRRFFFAKGLETLQYSHYLW
jgi:hypothetical protein